MPGLKTQKAPAGSAKAARTVTPPPPAEDEHHAEEGSLADVFDRAKPQCKVDDGKYDAIIRELVLQDMKDNKQLVRIKYHIISEGEFQGQEIAQFYGILQIVNGKNQAGPGLGFLKRDMAILGFNEPTLGELKQIFDEITNNEELGVMITVKTNTTNQGVFTNAYLNGIMPESDSVKEYREEHPF